MLLQDELGRQYCEEDHTECKEAKSMTWCVSVGTVVESVGAYLLSLWYAYSLCHLGIIQCFQTRHCTLRSAMRHLLMGKASGPVISDGASGREV